MHIRDLHSTATRAPHPLRKRLSPPNPQLEAPEEPQKTWWWDDAPGWAGSLLFHAALLCVLALITVAADFRERLPEIIGILGEHEEPAVELELETEIAAIPFEAAEEKLTILDLQNTSSEETLEIPLETPPIDPIAPTDQIAVLETVPQFGSPELSGRTSPAQKAAMIAREGGTPESEAAVALGLQWLANHQRKDGSWNFNHKTSRCRNDCSKPGSLGHCTTASTGLALLCFLGAGHSEKSGEYKRVVRDGTQYLVKQLSKNRRGSGNLMGPYRRNEGMYAQGIATLALCEAYNLGRNKRLREPVQEAVTFIVQAQDPRGGGWRYRPKEAGDTSVVGWQVMALYSGRIAELDIPQQTFDGAWYFLDSVQSDGGAAYGYMRPGPRPTLTAVGLLCRLYLGQSHGWKTSHPIVQQGAQQLATYGPSKTDMYYNYYATQVMRHYDGPEWEEWNIDMRDYLVKTQARQDANTGSWFFGGKHGADQAGRLYHTALATMILEVYYRHLPIYQKQSSEDDFPIN